MNLPNALIHGAGPLRGALAIGVALSIAACAAAPRVYVDAADEPLSCRSFGWFETPERPASIAEQRVRAEAMRLLRVKGYTEDNDEPDCLVAGAIYSGSRPTSPVSVGLGAGRWGGSFGTSVGVTMPVGGGARTVGNLAIDVIDVGLNAEVWRGTLESAFRTPEPTSDEIGEAVRKILEEFPARGLD